MQAQQAVDGLKVTGDKTAAKEQIKALYKTFTDSDCTMVEVCLACSIHGGAHAQRKAHMAPVWQNSTSVSLQYPFLIQLFKWTSVQTLQAGLTWSSPGQLHAAWCAGLQINPLAETEDGKLVAADAKLGFDDNAAFRHKDLFAERDASQEDPRSGPPPLGSHVLTLVVAKYSPLAAGALFLCRNWGCRAREFS